MESASGALEIFLPLFLDEVSWLISLLIMLLLFSYLQRDTAHDSVLSED